MDEGFPSQATQKTKTCRGCGSRFEPNKGASNQAYCLPDCRRNSNSRKQNGPQTPATTIGGKRDGNHLSPHAENSNKKDKKEDPSAKERAMFVLEESDLVKLGQVELVEIIMNLRDKYQEVRRVTADITRAKRGLEKELLEAKVAFADRALERTRRGGAGVPVRQSYASVAGGRVDEGRAVLVARVESSAGQIGLSKIDALLDSSKSGPVVQDVRQKEDKLIMTFSDRESREAARGILEGSQEGRALFTSVSNSTGYFPLLVRYVSVGTTEEEILSEIRYRNPILRENLRSAKIVHRFKESNEGHVKLWITSRETRDIVLQRGEIYLSGRRCRVTELDLHREVRRCFKCQQYGHLLKDCQSKSDVCGRCAGPHRTSTCQIQDQNSFRCSNCKRRPDHLKSVSDGRHQAGDRYCPEQMKAVERYRRNNGL